jgi:hypothetical protein
MKAAPALAMDRKDSSLPPEALKRLQLLNKLHPAIAALIERLRVPGQKPGAEEAKFVHDGKAEIQLWLTGTDASTLADLKRLGFEIILQPRSAQMLIGRIPIASLDALSKLNAVRYISPSS